MNKIIARVLIDRVTFLDAKISTFCSKFCTAPDVKFKVLVKFAPRLVFVDME